MTAYSKPRHIWRALWPVLAFFGIQIIGGVILLTGLVAHHGDEALYWLAENSMFLSTFTAAAMIALYLPLWQGTKESHPTLNGGKVSKKSIVFTVGLFLGLNLLLSSIMELTRVVEFFPGTIEHHEALFAGGGLILRIVMIGFLAGIIEELLFRGVLLNRLTEWMPTWAAVLISSIVFGLVHMDPFQILYATFMGLIFAWSYIRTKNLWIPIVGHVVFNMTSVLLGYYMEVTGTEISSVILLIPSVILTVACMVLIQKIPLKDE